jgi:hypothetical protein
MLFDLIDTLFVAAPLLLAAATLPALVNRALH